MKNIYHTGNGKRAIVAQKGSHSKQLRKDFSRTCNLCSDTESLSSGTLFHRVKYGLRKAFVIYF